MAIEAKTVDELFQWMEIVGDFLELCFIVAAFIQTFSAMNAGDYKRTVFWFAWIVLAETKRIAKRFHK